MKKLIITFLLVVIFTSTYVAPVKGASNKTNQKKDKVLDTVLKTTDQAIKTSDKEIKDYEKRLQKYKGYVTTSLNIRTLPSAESKVVGMLYYGEQINYQKYNKNWLKIKEGYVSAKYITNKKPKSTIYHIPENSGYKSYTNYTMITDTTSPQWELQQIAETNELGIRTVDGRYCVAIGYYFDADIGQYFDLILENGAIIHCIKSDEKRIEDTDESNIFSFNGCCSEFTVEEDCLVGEALTFGDISKCQSDWESPVVKIKIYNKGYW